jgi:hypothetical protein
MVKVPKERIKPVNLLVPFAALLPDMLTQKVE